MDSLPDEMLASELLPRCAEFLPALRCVCRRWRVLTAGLRRRTAGVGLSFLAENGHRGLLEWTRTARLSGPQLCGMYAAAARGGDLDLMTLVREWGKKMRDANATPQPLAINDGIFWHPFVGSPLDPGISMGAANTASANAAWKGHTHVLEFLRGLNEIQLGLALYCAAYGGHSQLADTLADWGAGNFGAGLVAAAAGGHAGLAETFLRRLGLLERPQVRGRRKKGGRVVRAVSQALHTAAGNGHAAVVSLLLREGERGVGLEALANDALAGDPNRDRRLTLLDRLLLLAARGGHCGLASKLLGAGARAGIDAFVLAARNGRVGMLELLRERVGTPFPLDRVAAAAAVADSCGGVSKGGGRSGTDFPTADASPALGAGPVLESPGLRTSERGPRGRSRVVQLLESWGCTVPEYSGPQYPYPDAMGVNVNGALVGWSLDTDPFTCGVRLAESFYGIRDSLP